MPNPTTAIFAHYARGLPPEHCAGAEGHDTASIGGLVALPPVIFATVRTGAQAAVDAALLTQLRLTHRSQKLEHYARALGELLVRLVEDAAPQVGTLASALAERLGFPAAAVITGRTRAQIRSRRHRRPPEFRLLYRSVLSSGPVSGGAMRTISRRR